MRETEFKKWLIDTNLYTDRSLNDKMSHCRRIEKITGKDLDSLLRSSSASEALEVLSSIISGKEFSAYNRSHLTRALTLYSEFYERTQMMKPSSRKR